MYEAIYLQALLCRKNGTLSYFLNPSTVPMAGRDHPLSCSKTPSVLFLSTEVVTSNPASGDLVET